VHNSEPENIKNWAWGHKKDLAEGRKVIKHGTGKAQPAELNIQKACEMSNRKPCEASELAAGGANSQQEQLMNS